MMHVGASKTLSNINKLYQKNLNIFNAAHDFFVTYKIGQPFVNIIG